jgi:hypothetical protein
MLTQSNRKEVVVMAMLTVKELTALEEQLSLEKLLQEKYQEAAKACKEFDIQSLFQQCAKQHQDNYTHLLSYLN